MNDEQENTITDLGCKYLSQNIWINL